MNRNLLFLILISFFIVTQPCMAMENKNHSLEIIKTFTHPELFNSITYLSKNTFLAENINGYKILNTESNNFKTVSDRDCCIVAINQQKNLTALANPNTTISCLHTREATQYNTSELHVESFNFDYYFNHYKKQFYPNNIIHLEHFKFNPRNNALILCLRDLTLGGNIITVNRFNNNSIESPILTTRNPQIITEVATNLAQEILCVREHDCIRLYSLNNLKELKNIPLSFMVHFCRISHKNILALMHTWHEKISLINLNTKDNIIMNLDASIDNKFDYMAFYPTTSILATTSSSGLLGYYTKKHNDQPILCFWNTTTLQPIFESVLPKDSYLCDFSPDGKEMLIKSGNTYTIYSTPHVIYGEHITNTLPYILFLLKNISTQDNPKTFLLNDIAHLIIYIYANKLSFY